MENIKIGFNVNDIVVAINRLGNAAKFHSNEIALTLVCSNMKQFNLSKERLSELYNHAIETNRIKNADIVKKLIENCK